MPLLRRLLGHYETEKREEQEHVQTAISEALDAADHAHEVIRKLNPQCNGRCPRRRSPADALIVARDRMGPP